LKQFIKNETSFTQIIIWCFSDVKDMAEINEKEKSNITMYMIIAVSVIIAFSAGYILHSSMGSITGAAVKTQPEPTEKTPMQFDGESDKCPCGCNMNLDECGCGTAQRIKSGAENPQVVEQPQEAGRVEVSVDDDPSKGLDNAPVTIVEFSDFQCSFCGRFFHQVLPQIEEEYIKTGKVKFVYRDFPLSFHQYAQKAAEAAECADEQGKFWEYHNILFQKQTEWSSGGISKLKEYAQNLGLDTGKFNECLDSGKYKSEVQKDFMDGSSYGVSGTPAFFINGIKVVGAQPFSAFQQIIEEELSK
jgi:protein-disulfide isomerase